MRTTHTFAALALMEGLRGTRREEASEAFGLVEREARGQGFVVGMLVAVAAALAAALVACALVAAVLLLL